MDREHNDYFALVSLTVYVLTTSLRTKLPLPIYLSDPNKASLRLLRLLRTHNPEAPQLTSTQLVYYFAFLSIGNDFTLELKRIGEVVCKLYGVSHIWEPLEPRSRETGTVAYLLG